MTISGKYVLSKFLQISSNNFAKFGWVAIEPSFKESWSHKFINSLMISISSPDFIFSKDFDKNEPEFGLLYKLFGLNKKEGFKPIFLFGSNWLNGGIGGKILNWGGGLLLLLFILLLLFKFVESFVSLFESIFLLIWITKYLSFFNYFNK